MQTRKELTAPCGLDCFNCEIYEGNLKPEVADYIQSKTGVPVEEIACRGCREQDGSHYHIPEGGCATLNCVRQKSVTWCFECEEFPCSLLAPLANGASRYPHNLKLYNLCRIMKVGIEQWFKEAGTNREHYFNDEFVVGKGQGE